MDDTDIIRDSVQKRVNIAIERIQFFLDKKQQYVISVEPDSCGTERIWFIRLSRQYSSIILCSAVDANRIGAEQIARGLAMILLVMGLSVQLSVSEEFEFTPEENKLMKRMEGLFLATDINLACESNREERLHSVVCEGSGGKIVLIETGGISEHGMSIICKQTAMILAGLGKHFSTPDGTIGNRYGIVEFCPINNDDV